MKLTGTDNVKKMLDRLMENSKGNVSEILGFAADTTTETARELCRNDYVKEKIKTEVQNDNLVRVNAYGEAAIHEEFGSESISPSPFILPALLQSKDKIYRYMEEKFKE